MNFTRVVVLSLSLSAVGCAAVSADTSHTSSPSQTLVFEVPNPPPEVPNAGGSSVPADTTSSAPADTTSSAPADASSSAQ